MAISYTEQPSGVAGANSPMIYQVSDTTYSGTAGFYYNFDIYVWSGTSTLPASPIATLTKLPDAFANGRAYIDIHRIVTEYISLEYLTFGDSTPSINTGAYYVQIQTSGYNDAGGGSPITPAVSSNLVTATRGYSLSKDGLNVDLQQAVYSDRETIYLTEQTQIDYIWYDANLVSSIDIGGHTITPAPIGTSSVEIQGFDIVDAMNTGGVWGTDSTITFNLSGGGTQEIQVQFDCETRYGSYSTLFVNRYGVYEGMTFNGVYAPKWEIQREEYMSGILRGQDISQPWNQGIRQNRQFNIQSKSTFVLNTNWLPESYVDIIGDLIMSEAIVFYTDSFYYGCKILDSSLDRKRATNDKLIQYALNFEFSQPYINKIVR